MHYARINISCFAILMHIVSYSKVVSNCILRLFIHIIELSEILQRTTQCIIKPFAPHERP